MRYLTKRYGTAFSMRLPGFGPAVVISEPALVKQLMQYPADVVSGVEPNLGVVAGPGAIFGLQGEAHRQRRKLLVPPFHGKRMRVYQSVVEEEILKATADWPEGEEFPVLPSMLRITLNTILRAVFGAEGAELVALREMMPSTVVMAQKLGMVPWLRHDFGPRSPWGRYLAKRGELYAVIEKLIVRAEEDPDLAQREDVLALMVQARYDDGSAMSHSDITEELFGLVGAGHETSAVSLAWAVERLRRHPDLLARLVGELDEGRTELLQATIDEVLRVRGPVDAVARRVVAPSIELGPWTIPRGYTVAVNVGLCHENPAEFPEPHRFNPDRFLGGNTQPYSWVPFGAGSRRCPGAAFATFELNIALRVLLREFRLASTEAPSERWQSRGVAFGPADGGLVVVHRRNTDPPATAGESAETATSSFS